MAHGLPQAGSGQVGGFTDRVVVGDDCNGIRGLCFEPAAASLATRWFYVGDGRGAYQKVGGYDDNSDKQVTADRASIEVWQMRRECVIVLVVSCCILGLLVLATYLHPVQSLLRSGPPQWPARRIDRQRGLVAVTTTPRYHCWDVIAVPDGVARVPDGHRRDWSDAKAAWCCENRGIGCVTTTTLAMPSSNPVEIDHGSRKDSSLISTSVQYDCKAGHPHLWPVGKTDWCCHHFSRGCSAPPTSHFDCDAGFAEELADLRWTHAKKDWCCKYYRRGCASSLSYNCATYASTWSNGKKAWCCYHQNLGCPTTTSKPFDCTAGLLNWRMDWSEMKQTWCCRSESLGCPIEGTSLNS